MQQIARKFQHPSGFGIDKRFGINVRESSFEFKIGARTGFYVVVACTVSHSSISNIYLVFSAKLVHNKHLFKHIVSVEHDKLKFVNVMINYVYVCVRTRVPDRLILISIILSDCFRTLPIYVVTRV